VDIETHTVKHTFVLPSFDTYYGPFERGGASTGQALAALPQEIRRAVREEVRRDLADTGGPVEAEGGVSDRQCEKVAGLFGGKGPNVLPVQASAEFDVRSNATEFFQNTYRVRSRRPSARHCASIRRLLDFYFRPGRRANAA